MVLLFMYLNYINNNKFLHLYAEIRQDITGNIKNNQQNDGDEKQNSNTMNSKNLLTLAVITGTSLIVYVSLKDRFKNKNTNTFFSTDDHDEKQDDNSQASNDKHSNNHTTYNVFINNEQGDPVQKKTVNNQVFEDDANKSQTNIDNTDATAIINKNEKYYEKIKQEESDNNTDKSYKEPKEETKNFDSGHDEPHHSQTKQGKKNKKQSKKKLDKNTNNQKKKLEIDTELNDPASSTCDHTSKTKKNKSKKKINVDESKNIEPEDNSQSIFEITNYKHVGVKRLQLENFTITILYSDTQYDDESIEPICEKLQDIINAKKQAFDGRVAKYMVDEYMNDEENQENKEKLAKKLRRNIEKTIEEMRDFFIKNDLMLAPYFTYQQSDPEDEVTMDKPENNFYNSLIDMMSIKIRCKEIINEYGDLERRDVDELIREIVEFTTAADLHERYDNEFGNYIFKSMVIFHHNILNSFVNNIDKISIYTELHTLIGDITTLFKSKDNISSKEGERLDVYLQCAGSLDLFPNGRQGQAGDVHKISHVQFHHARNEIVGHDGKYYEIDIFTEEERKMLYFQSTYMTRCYQTTKKIFDQWGNVRFYCTRVTEFNYFNVILNAGFDFKHEIFKNENIDNQPITETAINYMAYWNYFLQPKILMINGIKNKKLLCTTLSDAIYSRTTKNQKMIRTKISKTIALFQEEHKQELSGRNKDFIQLILFKPQELTSKKNTIEKIIDWQ